MNKYILAIFLSVFTLALNAQKATWKNFSHAKFQDKYIKEYDSYAMLIVYDDKLKEIDGKEITITGYYIPVKEDVLIISRYPNSACFFCGAAGMESIMEVRTKKKPKKYKTDKLLTYKGRVKVNYSDWKFVSLILEDAELIEAH